MRLQNTAQPERHTSSLIEVRTYANAGRISFNRSIGCHALTAEMYGSVFRALSAWEIDDRVSVIIIDHSEGTRGFCSGSDLVGLSNISRIDFISARACLALRYRLVQMISNYPKPIVTFLDGNVLGAAIGLANNGSHQVASENTVLAFPETGVGYVPDGGATWLLSRLPFELGVWLALTGARLMGADVSAVGLASHFCASDEIATLKRRLGKEGIQSISEYTARSEFSMPERLPEIERLFAGACARQIRRRLEGGSDWAESQATKFLAKSPLAIKIALKQVRTGQFLGSLGATLQLEYRITSRLIHSRDFHEGVRALLVRRDYCPDWTPQSSEQVTFDMVAQYFSPLRTGELALF